MSLSKKDRKIRSESGKYFPNGVPLAVTNAHFVAAVAEALREEFGGSGSAVKSIVRLTGANERAVKNWLAGRNGPSGEFLVSLMRHSDRVLESLLILSGREKIIMAKKLADARQKLDEMIAIIDDLQYDGTEKAGD